MKEISDFKLENGKQFFKVGWKGMGCMHASMYVHMLHMSMHMSTHMSTHMSMHMCVCAKVGATKMTHGSPSEISEVTTKPAAACEWSTCSVRRTISRAHSSK